MIAPGKPLSPSVMCPLATWTLGCVILNVAGWGLSLAGKLNSEGYGLVLLASVVWVLFYWWRYRPAFISSFQLSRLAKRLRRPLPAAFVVLAALAGLGGILHGPSNYDGLAYRIPRVLHWLAEGQWHWIHTDFPRLNTRACGFEWLMAPFLAFFKTDRFIFLLNMGMYLFLPGLTFSTLKLLGVSSRVSWNWMWILPTGYCFLLQAGSIGNDFLGAFYAWVALRFALRARSNLSPHDAFLSVLAAALMTGAKASNLPLLLPWVIVIFPLWRVFGRHIGATLVVGAVASLCSFLPMACLNYLHCGDWSGQKAENANLHKGLSSTYLVNNVILLAIQNIAPPIFPLAAQWEKITPHLMTESFRLKIRETFEPAGANWSLGELQIEETAGLGFGVTTLILGSLLVGLRRGEANGGRSKSGQKLGFYIFITTSLALGVFMAKSGLSPAARLVTPYYLFFFPFLLSFSGQAGVIRATCWRWCVCLLFILATLVLVLSPARPLWPAQAILGALGKKSSSRFLERARTVYEVYGARYDSFAPARKNLPLGLKKIGFITFDDPEASLWRPYGSRRVFHVTSGDGPSDLSARKIQYILVSREIFSTRFRRDFSSWLLEMNGKVEQSFRLSLRASTGPTEWYLVRLGSKNP